MIKNLVESVLHFCGYPVPEASNSMNKMVVQLVRIEVGTSDLRALVTTQGNHRSAKQE